jgi:hypothetical protein
MKTNHWIAFSLRFYRQLLRLYPQAHRASYKMEMLRVFKNQCREAYQQQGGLGILLLWPRTLIDVSITVVREHLSDPQAKVGLLDATPNAPLPWKGVLLVLIPGLIFFVSQIEQLISNNDWFFLAFYRAGYFLILPVLIAWVLTRRFPIWGLIPFGLLYAILGSYSPNYLIDKLPYFSDTSSLAFFGIRFNLGYLIAVSACTVLLCGLIWYNTRRGQLSPSAWKWLGLYGLLVIFQLVTIAIGEAGAQEFAWIGWQTVLSTIEMKQMVVRIFLWYLYTPLSFLLLIFIGTVFSRKYKNLTFLLLLGYLLPTVLFGRYSTWHDFVSFYLVSLAILVYRFIVALVAPLWLVRAASISGRRRAAAIPVAMAILCHISLNLIVALAWASQSGFQTNMLDLASIIWNQLIIAAGLGLAVVLYLPKEEDQAIISHPVFAATTE